MKNRKGPSMLFTNALVILMFCATIGFTTGVHAVAKNFQNSLYETYYQGNVPEPKNVEEALSIIVPVEGTSSVESLIRGRGAFKTDTVGYGKWYMSFGYNKLPSDYPDPTKGDIICYFQLLNGTEKNTFYIPKESWKEVEKGYFDTTVVSQDLDILLTLHHFGNDPAEWNIYGDITLK